MKKLLLPIAVVTCVVGAQNVSAQAQSHTVTGQVMDTDGSPLKDATITVKGTANFTTSDENGDFQIEVPSDDATLVVTTPTDQVGKEFKANSSNPLVLNLGDVEDNDDVVIIGYGGGFKASQQIGGMTVVGEKAFKNVPIASFTNMLQGQVAGLNVTSTSGAPGSNATFQLHGVSSINGSTSPLIVIDGVPSTAAAYNSLNPNDIESTTVLKDASSTAIYGSRGANGVILVTTKRGGKVKGKPTVSYGFQYGFKSLTPLHYKMMDVSQKLQYEDAAGYNNWVVQGLGLSSASLADKQSALQSYATDWTDELVRTGHMAVHDISIAGTSEDGKFNYYTSFQWYKENGLYRIGDAQGKGDYFDRKSGSLNFTYSPYKWLTIGENSRVAFTHSVAASDFNNVQSPWRARTTYNPYESVYLSSDDPLYAFANANGLAYASNDGHIYNLTLQGLSLIEQDRHRKMDRQTLFGSNVSYLEIKPIEGLKLRTQLGLQYTNFNYDYFLEPSSYLSSYFSLDGLKSLANQYRINYVWTNTAEYSKVIKNDHFFDIIAGTEYTNDRYRTLSASNQGYQDNGLDALTVGSTTSDKATGTNQVWGLMSYFGRGQYTYKGRYFLTGSYRRDGYTGFGPDKKWGNFYGVGAAWDISKESFFDNASKYVNHLKPHVSYGMAGNNGLPTLYDAYANVTQTTYGSNSAYVLSSAGNPNLGWETMKTFTAGFDFVAFDNRFSGTIDYYNRASVDLLGAQNISLTSGFSSYTANVGKLTNSGVEVTLNYDIIRKKDFQWSIGGNFTFNHNMINRLNNDPNDSTILYSSASIIKKGYAINTYYLPEYAGVDKQYGNDTWYDADGNVTSDYSSAPSKIQNKSSNPRYFGSLNTSVFYKGIGLSMMFYYSGGNYILNQSWANVTHTSGYQSNMATDALDYWTESNPNAKWAAPSQATSYSTWYSTQYLQKGDFIRLRNVTLSYDFPKSLLGKTSYISAARIYVMAQNLLTFTGVKGDPEYGSGNTYNGYGNDIVQNVYPQTKAITFGVNVTF